MFSLTRVAEYARAVKILQDDSPGGRSSSSDDDEAGQTIPPDRRATELEVASDEDEKRCEAESSTSARPAEDFTVPPEGCMPLTKSKTGGFCSSDSATPTKLRSGRAGGSISNDPFANFGLNVFDSDLFWKNARIQPEICYNHSPPTAPKFRFPDVTFQDLLRGTHSTESTMHQPFEIQTTANATLLKKMLRRKQLSRTLRKAFFTASMDSTDQYLLGSPNFVQFVNNLGVKPSRLRVQALFDSVVKPLPAATLGSFFLAIDAIARAVEEASQAARETNSTSAPAPTEEPLSECENAAQKQSPLCPPPPRKSSLQYLETFVFGPVAKYVEKYLPEWADPEINLFSRDRRLVLAFAQQRPMLHHIFEVFSQQFQSSARVSFSDGQRKSVASRVSIATPKTPKSTTLTPTNSDVQGTFTPQRPSDGVSFGSNERLSVASQQQQPPRSPGTRRTITGRKSMLLQDPSEPLATPLTDMQAPVLEAGFASACDTGYFLQGSQWRRILRIQAAARIVVNLGIPGLTTVDVVRAIKASACLYPTHTFRQLAPPSGKAMPAVYLTKFLVPGEIFLLEPEFEDFVLRLAAIVEVLHRADITPEDAFVEAQRRVSTRRSVRYSIIPKEAEKVVVPRVADRDVSANPFATSWKDVSQCEAVGRLYDAFVYLSSRYLSVLYSSTSTVSVASILQRVNFLELRSGLLEIQPPSVCGLSLISDEPATDASSPLAVQPLIPTSPNSHHALDHGAVQSAEASAVELREQGGHVRILGTNFVVDRVYVLVDGRVSVRCAVIQLPSSSASSDGRKSAVATTMRDGTAALAAADFYVPSLDSIFPSSKLINKQRPRREITCVQDSTTTMRIGISLRFEVPLQFSNDGKFWIDATEQSSEDVVRHHASFKRASTICFRRKLPMVMVPSWIVEPLLIIFRVYAEYENPSRTHLMSESKWQHFCGCFFAFEYDIDISTVKDVSQFVKDAIACASWKQEHCTNLICKSPPARGAAERAAPISFSGCNVPRVHSREIRKAFALHATNHQRGKSYTTSAADAGSPASTAPLLTLSPPQFVAAIVDVICNLCSKYVDQEVELRHAKHILALQDCWRTILGCLHLEHVRRVNSDAAVHSLEVMMGRQNPAMVESASPVHHLRLAPDSSEAADVWRIQHSLISFQWVALEADLIQRQRDAARAVTSVARTYVSHGIFNGGICVGEIAGRESHLYPQRGEVLLQNDWLSIRLADEVCSERVQQIIALNLPYVPTVQRLISYQFHFLSVAKVTSASSDAMQETATRRLWLIRTASGNRIIGVMSNIPGQFSTLQWVPQLAMFESSVASITMYINEDSNADANLVTVLREIFSARTDRLNLLRRGIESEGFVLDPLFPGGQSVFSR